LKILSLLLLLGCAAPPIETSPSSPDVKNVLIIITDDVGATQIEQTPTPVLDVLMKNGVTFTNAWSQPTCSPTRMSILSGKHPHQAGVGSDVGWFDTFSPDTDEQTLGKLVTAPAALIGKWHLSTKFADPGQGPIALGGMDFYSGNLNASLGQFNHTYDSWVKTVSFPGSTSSHQSTVYATTQTVDDAVDWIGNQDAAWLCVVAFNAPHKPWHNPPEDLVLDPQGPRTINQYREMLQALDLEVGRMLRGLPQPVLEQTLVIWVGDNGPPSEVTADPYIVPERGKGTVYQGGIHVPLVLAMMDTNQPGRTVDDPVMAIDLFQTALAALGASLPTGFDGQSLLPYLRNPGFRGRGWAYAEKFLPNGSGPYTEHQEAVVDREGYKLIRDKGTREQMYDLAVDPGETTNLLNTALRPGQIEALARLRDLLNGV